VWWWTWLIWRITANPTRYRIYICRQTYNLVSKTAANSQKNTKFCKHHAWNGINTFGCSGEILFCTKCLNKADIFAIHSCLFNSSISTVSSVTSYDSSCGKEYYWNSWIIYGTLYKLKYCFTLYCTLVVIILCMKKKNLDSDWLRAVQFKCNTSVKSVTPV